MDKLLDGPYAITLALIAVSTAVSIIGFWALRKKEYRQYFVFIPSKAARGENRVGTFVSHFAHGNVGHLLVNMITLFFFGRGVEKALGHWKYLALYAASGAVATLTVYLFRRKNPRHSALGASGCISGIVFAAVVVEPTASFALWPMPFPLPAPAFAVLYLVMSSLMMGRGDRVAHEAHIGGAVAGFIGAGLLFAHGFGPVIRAVQRLLS